MTTRQGQVDAEGKATELADEIEQVLDKHTTNGKLLGMDGRALLGMFAAFGAQVIANGNEHEMREMLGEDDLDLLVMQKTSAKLLARHVGRSVLEAWDSSPEKELPPMPPLPRNAAS